MSKQSMWASLARGPAMTGALLLAVAVVSAALTVRFLDQDAAMSPTGAQSAPGHRQPGQATPAPAPTAIVAATPSAVTVPDAQRLYTSAQLFADCEERAKESASIAGAPDEAYEIDPTGTLAARLEQERNTRGAECRPIGPAQYRQVDQMLQVAAAQGNRDARALLLRRRAQALMERAQPDAHTGERPPFNPTEEGEARAIGTGLEELALTGHRESMVALDQLLSATQPSDPTRAAAWRLVARQKFGAPFPPPDKLPGSEELLDEMDGAGAQATLTLAKSLFERCCAR